MPLPRILEPLKIRDFALLWSGMTVSMLGDRFFYVALAWETYTLSNSPLAYGIVAGCSTAPFVVFVIFGGVLTDRIERRRLMIASDVIRATSIGTIGALAITGHLRLWELGALVAVAGVGSALFRPAFGSIIPEIVPPAQLTQANALAGFVRPTVGLVGPALSGIVIAVAGAGWAFAGDAVSYGASTAAALALTSRPVAKKARSFKREIGEGYAFIRKTPWLYGSLLASLPLNVAVATNTVLLPFIVKNDIHGSATSLGLVYSAGAVGALVGTFLLGQRGLPPKHVAVMYLGWTISVGGVAGYGLARDVPTMLAIGIVAGGFSAVGQAIWGTMMHTLRPTLIVAGVFSAIVNLAFLIAWPGMRGSESDGSMRPSDALA